MWSNHQIHNRKGRFNTHTYYYTYSKFIGNFEEPWSPLTDWQARQGLPAYSSGDMLVIVCVCVCVCVIGV